MAGTEIANEALARIGQSVITDINSTAGETARACKLLFEPTCKEVMRSHQWNCLKTRAQLALNATPAFGWAYSYTLPTQCLRLVTVNGAAVTDNYKQDYFEIEGRDILTDADVCQITYIAYNADTTKWDSLLKRCIVTLLASKLASKLAQDDELSQILLQQYEKVDLRKAQRIDANESRRRPYSPIGDSTWVSHRHIQPG